jgi:hypothetical protein
MFVVNTVGVILRVECAVIHVMESVSGNGFLSFASKHFTTTHTTTPNAYIRHLEGVIPCVVR